MKKYKTVLLCLLTVFMLTLLCSCRMEDGRIEATDSLRSPDITHSATNNNNNNNDDIVSPNPIQESPAGTSGIGEPSPDMSSILPNTSP